MAPQKLSQWLEWLALAGLPIGSAISAVTLLIARFFLVPLYADADIYVSDFALACLSWPFNLSCVILPLLGCAASLAVSRSTLVRVVLGVLLFHVWLLAFLVGFVGILLPALTA